MATKRVKGLGEEWKRFGYDFPLDASLANPDVLTDEAKLWPERDTDAEDEYEDRRNDCINRLNKAFVKLKPKDRSLIKLWLQYKSHGDIADVLGVTREAVTMRLGKLFKKLKKLTSVQ